MTRNKTKLHLYLYSDSVDALRARYGDGNLSHTVRRVLDKHLGISRPESEYVDRLESRVARLQEEFRRVPRKKKK